MGKEPFNSTQVELKTRDETSICASAREFYLSRFVAARSSGMPDFQTEVNVNLEEKFKKRPSRRLRDDPSFSLENKIPHNISIPISEQEENSCAWDVSILVKVGSNSGAGRSSMRGEFSS